MSGSQAHALITFTDTQSVISQFLPTAIFGPAAAPPKAADAPNIAIATYNQRGIGKSGGSMPIPSFGLGNDPADFGTIEATILDLVGTDATQVYRLVSPPPVRADARGILVRHPAGTERRAARARRGEHDARVPRPDAVQGPDPLWGADV